MFKKLFGGGGKPAKPVSEKITATTVDAIEKLRETEELLAKRSNLLDKNIAQELQRAKELAQQKNDKAALAALAKKKMYQGQLEKIENNILRVSEQIVMLENQIVMAFAVDALEQATVAGKAISEQVNIDRVYKVIDDITEQAENVGAISDALAQPMGAAADLDDEELMGELEDLKAQAMEVSLLEPAPVPTTKVPQAAMPSVPAEQPVKQQPAKTPEELELEQIKAGLAI